MAKSGSSKNSLKDFDNDDSNSDSVTLCSADNGIHQLIQPPEIKKLNFVSTNDRICSCVVLRCCI